jgi:hypothetical protein
LVGPGKILDPEGVAKGNSENMAKYIVVTLLESVMEGFVKLVRIYVYVCVCAVCVYMRTL